MYLINSQLHRIHHVYGIHRVPESSTDYNCKISRQKTALTDTLNIISLVI